MAAEQDDWTPMSLGYYMDRLHFVTGSSGLDHCRHWESEECAETEKNAWVFARWDVPTLRHHIATTSPANSPIISHSSRPFQWITPPSVHWWSSLLSGLLSLPLTPSVPQEVDLRFAELLVVLESALCGTRKGIGLWCRVATIDCIIGTCFI